jgi:hypothetical protein
METIEKTVLFDQKKPIFFVTCNFIIWGFNECRYGTLSETYEHNTEYVR